MYDTKKIVYTAQSKYHFYARMMVCKYVLEHGAIPLNPFNVWEYFVYESVNRDLVRRGNNNILRKSDEVWVFGTIPDGVLAEIEYAMKLKKPVKFFTIGSRHEDIKPLEIDCLLFEKDALLKKTADEIKNDIKEYISHFGDGKLLYRVNDFVNTIENKE